MLKYVAMGIAAAAVGIVSGLYLNKRVDDKSEAAIRNLEENLDHITAECNPFNDEKFEARFRENLRKCAEKDIANLCADVEKHFAMQRADFQEGLKRIHLV